MSWANFHTHSCFCDGKGELRDYVEEAIRQRMSALGFSSHAPLPFHTDWTMAPADLDEYCRQVRALKKEYAGQLPIYLGLEIDFIPDVTNPRAPQFQSSGLDYVIGSVHFYEEPVDGNYLTIDGTEEEFAEGIKRNFNGSVRHAVEAYYALIRRMVREACPDVIAHLDLVKKNSPREKYFQEREEWYRKAVIETLDTIQTSRAIIEVNTGGVTRKRSDTFYPSTWILKEIKKRDIPISLNSDVHSPHLITGHFKEAAKTLLKLGFTHLYVLTPSGWRPCSFSPDGLDMTPGS